MVILERNYSKKCSGVEKYAHLFIKV